MFLFTLISDYNHRLVGMTFNDLEWPEVNIILNEEITKSPINQPLCICKINKKRNDIRI
jgi:hypothetical protein